MASPLTEPSPSPSPSPSPLSRPSPPKQIVPIATRPAMPRLLPRLSKAGLDSESELSELSEDDETEQKAPESAPLEQGEEEEEEDEDEDEENQDDKADDDSTTRSRSRAHRKKGSLLPEPMWGWAYKKRTKEGTANHAPSSSKPAGTHAKNGTASEPAFNEEEEEEEEPEEEDEEDEAFALETKSSYTRPISTSLSHSGSKNGLLPTPITHPVNGDDEPEEEDATEDEEDEHATEAGTEHGVVADAEEAEDDDGEDDQEADGSSSLDRSRPPTPDDQAILPLPIPPTIPKSPLSSPEPDSSGIHSHPPKIIDGDVDMDGELDGDPDVEIDDNSERDPDQELDAEMDQDADPEQEAEVDHEQEPDQEVDAETEHDLSSAHRAEALDVLTAIEIKFAELRERLYLEKMEDLQVEEELVLKNIHPEMIHLQNELEKRRERRKELADKKRKYEEEAVELKRRVDGNGILAWWKHERDELQSEMMADTNRKRRRLERERRLVERPLPSRNIPNPPLITHALPLPPTLRQIIKTKNKYGVPVDALRDPNMRVHPPHLQPKLKQLTPADINQDFDMIFPSRRWHSHPNDHGLGHRPHYAGPSFVDAYGNSTVFGDKGPSWRGSAQQNLPPPPALPPPPRGSYPSTTRNIAPTPVQMGHQMQGAIPYHPSHEGHPSQHVLHPGQRRTPSPPPPNMHMWPPQRQGKSGMENGRGDARKREPHEDDRPRVRDRDRDRDRDREREREYEREREQRLILQQQQQQMAEGSHRSHTHTHSHPPHPHPHAHQHSGITSNGASSHSQIQPSVAQSQSQAHHHHHRHSHLHHHHHHHHPSSSMDVNPPPHPNGYWKDEHPPLELARERGRPVSSHHPPHSGSLPPPPSGSQAHDRLNHTSFSMMSTGSPREWTPPWHDVHRRPENSNPGPGLLYGLGPTNAQLRAQQASAQGIQLVSSIQRLPSPPLHRRVQPSPPMNLPPPPSLSSGVGSYGLPQHGAYGSRSQQASPPRPSSHTHPLPHPHSHSHHTSSGRSKRTLSPISKLGVPLGPPGSGGSTPLPPPASIINGTGSASSASTMPTLSSLNGYVSPAPPPLPIPISSGNGIDREGHGHLS